MEVSLYPTSIYSLTGQEKACGLEQLWSEALGKLRLFSATLLASSSYDSTRRTYLLNDMVYKIVLLERDSTASQRRNNLAKEFEIIKSLHGITGIPEAITFEVEENIGFAKYCRAPGRPLSKVHINPKQSCRIVVSLLALLIKTSIRGISHNDVHADNVLLSARGQVSLVDFDQASQVSVYRALMANLFGIGNQMGSVYGSLITIMKHQLTEHLSPTSTAKLKRYWHRAWKSPERRLPKLKRNASPQLKALLKAWKLAQLSNANAPGQNVSYYSLQFENYSFPGERPWLYRWRTFQKIDDFRNKRILELGCNLSLLSCFLLKHAQASAAMAVDADSNILSAARYVAFAFDVSPIYLKKDFDMADEWETELIAFKPDVIFALSILNWVKDKKRFMSFLSRFDDVIFEGHESLEVETTRFVEAGFDEVEQVAMSERKRPVLRCRKWTTEI
jgi:predicted Ser/Thr protein kinase